MEKFCIDARQLWNELDCPQGQFNKWVERKFKPYGFSENIDFKPFGQISPKPQGGRPEKDYSLTIDMAKQLSMIDKKEAGFIARRYFILMERIVKDNKDWMEVRFAHKNFSRSLIQIISSCFLCGIDLSD
ncbi:antA/AntB antirepressor family protein [[Clostridium] scindens]|uniref:antA/AntB antirepressor family protein n=1 Tax=Clostridium scindens (strain JCM 10418 / VPI 12708) TaxID=29347 RepID=UPI001D07A544|nr:antA/AntB antirepressor family protein [[Clostridium] scindens]MCB6288535.1 antA/AntB antirepressor family protein [[Clostridium] scindens]MCB6422509.1 antA/AntB antirepressor family protein [[Clostridium] scindens]MCB7194858.1 antA/AntB antirepressor family protein [[Clostridium] scindens]MCB7288055.1 antA/AntB antirepressor family protein [[Clostridium] scindens]MCG4930588.1 antA/AntB antirepressor family protein [[Clostridium] scindens]